MSLTIEEKSITQEIVQKTNKNICPKCGGYLHSLPRESRQNYCFSCGIQWNLQEIEDYCMEEIDKLKAVRFPEKGFIDWCYSKLEEAFIG